MKAMMKYSGSIVLLVSIGILFAGACDTGGGTGGNGGGPVSITYLENNALRGTAPVDSGNYIAGDVVTVLDNDCWVMAEGLVGPEVTGHEGTGIAQVFRGWSTDADATDPLYLPGQEFVIAGDITLYAVYTDDSDAVRKIGPAGGYIFYVDDSGADNIYYETAPEAHWKAFHGSGGDDPQSQWGASENWSPGFEIGSTEIGIGFGSVNTESIVSAHDALLSTDGNNTSYYDYEGDYGTEHGFTDGVTDYTFRSVNDGTVAAKLCDDYITGGFDDWFLPSRDELIQMYETLHTEGLGGFYVGSASFWSSTYWSSTETSHFSATSVSFSPVGGGDHDQWNKHDNEYVRAIRSFSE